MAWIRQRPSGLWAATVYTPTGERVTESHEFKTVITAWAKKLETDKTDGSFIDPRKGKIPVGEIWDLYAEDRTLEKASHARDRSHWNKWVGPKWTKIPVGPIRRPHITAWVADMDRRGAKGWTQTAAVNVLRSMLDIAVNLGLIATNPCVGVKVTPPEPHEDRVLEEWEDDLLLGNLELRFPGDPTAGLFVESLLYTGARYEELAAVQRSVVRSKERGFWVHRVMEKDGALREYAKTSAGLRFVGLDDDLWPRFLQQVMTVGPDDLVFQPPGGGPLLYDAWRKRVWLKGLLRVVPWDEERIAEYQTVIRANGKRRYRMHYQDEVPILDDPQPTAHDCRHTFGTRCAECGMPRHELAATLGHSPNSNAVDRYLHARNKRLDRARAAMATVRKSRSPGRPSIGNCVQCGQKLPGSYDHEKQRETSRDRDTGTIIEFPARGAFQQVSQV